ncbi:MAG: transposase [Betaproteobacteria bacterium]|nr:transposase [Betaproteobacteria bacterium]
MDRRQAAGAPAPRGRRRAGRRVRRLRERRAGRRGARLTSPAHARRKIEAWRIDFNEQRPHGSLGNHTPSEVLHQNEVVKPAAEA